MTIRSPHAATGLVAAADEPSDVSARGATPPENRGYVYRSRVTDAGDTVLAYHVARFRHSDEAAWRESIELGRVLVNGRRVAADEELRAGDELEFHRPPWREPEAPERFDVAFEDDH